MYAIRRISAVGALALGACALVLVLSQGDNAVAKGHACPHQNAKPGQASSLQFAKSIKCLINKERTKRGLSKLHVDSDLSKLEARHLRLMLRKDCFKHRCRGEKSLTKRVKQSGYLDGARHFTFGENLGYETTPKAMIKRFMGDRSHRKNVLVKNAQDIGVAAGGGAPVKGLSDSAFVTYGALVAGRKP